MLDLVRKQVGDKRSFLSNKTRKNFYFHLQDLKQSIPFF